MKEIILILRFVVIALIYIILYRLIRIMVRDLRLNIRKSGFIDFAMEVVEAPDFSGVAAGTIFPVREATSIGRQQQNEIVLNDPYVSGKHALLTSKKGKLFLEDNSSKNGTFVNGKPLVGEKELGDGDLIEIGRVVFRIIG